MSREANRVYLLHGLLETGQGQFGSQLSKWKEARIPIPVDLPGHGHCPIDARAPYVATAVQYGLAVIERFGRGDLVAASYLGGPVAVRCALARPDLVRSLVLSGFVPSVPRDVFMMWLDGFVRVAADDPKLRQWYQRRHGPRWPRTLEAYSLDARERYETSVGIDRADLQALEPPTLLLNGALKSNERSAAERAAELGPSVQGHVIPRAGHLPSRDQPERFLAVVQAFWDDRATRADAPIP